LKEGRITTLQSLSGTGALRLGVEFVKKFLPKGTTIYFPKPTWGNHFVSLYYYNCNNHDRIFVNMQMYQLVSTDIGMEKIRELIFKDC